MDAILVVNAGSSSLKFQIFEIAGASLVRCVRGQIDGIGTTSAPSGKSRRWYSACRPQTYEPDKWPTCQRRC
jgi:acetate kinase